MAANDYDISAGIVPIDNSTGAEANNYYIAAGLVPADLPVASASHDIYDGFDSPIFGGMIVR